MTDIDTVATRTDEHAEGVLLHLDPHTVEVGDNVREYPNLTKPFLDSIREHGGAITDFGRSSPSHAASVRRPHAEGSPWSASHCGSRRT